MNKKNILFISPLDPDVPSALKLLMGGEHTYTKMRLNNPPSGASFIHVSSAITAKLVTLHWLTYFFLWLQKFRILPPGPRVYVLKNISPLFDGIYAHAHPVKIIGRKIPLTISDSSSNMVFLDLYQKRPKIQLLFFKYTKKCVYKLFSVIDGEENAHLAKSRFVFSHWAIKKKKEYGVTDHFAVLYPGLQNPDIVTKRTDSSVIKFLFVGVWFERKGGQILLEAYKKLAKMYKNCSLTILGEIPAHISITKIPRLTHKTFVSYNTLQKLYARHDVLIHVPPRVEGYGMAVVEAMSFGLSPIVSKVCALPEFITDKKEGLIIEPDSSDALYTAMMYMVEHPQKLQMFKKNASKRFQKQFGMEIFNKKLWKLLIK